jgi:intracellular sulfur oxidation DsrE/DsrF family protein
MKAFAVALFMLTGFTAGAQSESRVVDQKVHKIVIQFSQGDSLEQHMMISQVGNIRASWPNAMIEVVCHGSGLDLITTSKTKVATQVAELSTKGVTFAACNNTMQRRKLKKEDLLPSPVVVPSAMLELVRRQEEGWAYLKGVH